MSWKEYSLKDVANFQNGYAFRSKDLKLERDENDLPIFKMGNIEVGGGFKEHGRQSYIDSELASGLEKHLTKDFDILMSMTDMKGNVRLLGHSAQLINHEPFLVNQRVGHIRPKDHIDKRFLYYYLNSAEYINEIRKTAHAGVQVNLSSEAIRNSVVNLPALSTQRRIASILSAYDDLIENNLKRIKLLEEAAQNIYREWFVEMRFPGHENVEWYTDENGRRLPVGWNLSLIQDFCNVSGGGTPSTKEPKYWEGGEILWFSPTDLSKNSSIVLTDSAKKITTEGLKNSSAKLLPERTILMSSRATIGLFGIISQPCTTNQGFINILPHNEWDRYYLLFNLMSRKVEIESYASGTTFKEISKQNFKKLDILVPHNCQLKEFHRHILPIIEMIERIEHTNNTLKEARDILLPRLMNQTIEV